MEKEEFIGGGENSYTVEDRQESLTERIESDIERYGHDILGSEELSRAYQQKHHLRSTLGVHTIRVVVISLMICYFLSRLHIRTDIPAVVKGSLCHDLGMLSRGEKYTSAKESNRKHPSESVDIARGLVDDLSEKTSDIIERHMWPVGRSKAPNSLECVIVSAADKYAAVKDFFKGSRVKRTEEMVIAESAQKPED